MPESKIDNDDNFDLVNRYNSIVQSSNYEYNREQVRVINELQGFGEKLLDHEELLHKYRKSDIKSEPEKDNGFQNNTSPSPSFWGIFSSFGKEEVEKKPNPLPIKQIKILPPQFKALEDTKSVYLHGNPGTGKTFVMDMLYNELPIKNKVRLHYSEFMLQIHEEEHKINLKKDRSVDTITQVGNEFCKGMDFLCVDEFQVLHISDAMILKRLFEAFMENNLV